MRTLTASLLAAQKQASAVPYLRVQAHNLANGVVRYKWTRLYTGSEPDGPHAAAMPADGSLVRARVTPLADGRKLYYQRVASPGPGSDFTAWTWSSHYDVLAVAVAALGQEVSIFWVESDRSIWQKKSTDSGATWGSAQIVAYTLTDYVYGMAAAYRPGGDVAVFYGDQSTLYIEKCVGGTWQPRSGWDKTTGDLSGVGCVYDGDWDLLVTGVDVAGNYKLWSLVYGDGGDVPAGTWSALKELASAPAGGSFAFQSPFVDKHDLPRLFFIEKFTGTEAYSRPFSSWSVPGAKFVDGLCREPVPFDLSSENGLAMAHSGSYAWLTTPAGVWRAPLTSETIDLTSDVIGAKVDLARESGRLVIELRNDRGQYATPGQGSLAALDIGYQVSFSPGYVSSSGNEASDGLSFTLDAWEHTSSGGKASLDLHASDGWAALELWRARNQFRWNKSSDEACVKDILAFVLARCGLKFDVKSESALATGFYPDFTISPQETGMEVVRKLLSFVPDLLYIEGNKGYLVNPLATDASGYSYGADHLIFEGRYTEGARPVNRTQVEGFDPVAGAPVLADRFAWTEIDRVYERLKQVEDRNLESVSEAQQRGDAILRKAEVDSKAGLVVVPVNCGQQLYDVIDITDARAGLSASKRRVMGLGLSYRPERGEYRERLYLGAV